MDLLDRYLRQVRSALPAAERDDITRELGENLRAQLDDRAEALGRPLTADEQREALADFGHPLAVASRFRTDQPSVAFGRRLIGPVVWPVYLRVLSITLVLAAVASALTLLLDRDAWTVSAAVGRIAGPLALSFLAITATFSLIDRYAATAPMRWDPDQEVPLPGMDARADDRRRVVTPAWRVRLGAIGELVVAAIGVGLWVAFRPDAFAASWVEPGPGWLEPWPWLLVPIGLGALAAAVRLARPAAERPAIVLSMAADAVGLVLLLWSLSLGAWLFADTAGSTDEVALAETLRGIIGVSLAVAAVIAAISLADGVRRLWRIRGSGRAV